MNNTDLRTRYAALQFTAQNIHCIKKDDTDELLFDEWWAVHYQSYTGIDGHLVLHHCQQIIAICLDA